MNPKAPISAEDAAVTAATPEQQKLTLDVDWGYITEVRDRWNERWRREIIAGGR